MAAARSMLFVPGDRPERFSKAAASGADAIVLDLEDAVGAENKDAARAAVDTWLGEHADTVAAVVRVNGTETHWHADDVAMLSGHRCAVMLPKATCAAQLRGVAAQLGAAAGVIALIETARGVLAAQEISSADLVVRTAFGSVDLARRLADAGSGSAPRSQRLPVTCREPSPNVEVVSWQWFWHRAQSPSSVSCEKVARSSRVSSREGAAPPLGCPQDDRS